MAEQQATLSFCWWNLHNFAHFDSKRAAEQRWPKRAVDFETKRDRILDALRELFAGDFPDLLAVCEITREAASELARLMSPSFDVAVAPTYPHDDGFQVAVIFRKGIGLTADTPLIAAEDLDVSEETRPMITVRLTRDSHVIRFVACHWPPFDTSQSRPTRRKLADYLRGNAFEFLRPTEKPTRLNRHLVVLGDLNEEPTSPLFVEELLGHRAHASSRRVHWRDESPRRVHLYNAAWRFLGEQVAYAGGIPAPSLAGTFYNKNLGWRTFDHLIVSGSLLNTPPPYLDEANCRVAITPAMRSPTGIIQPYDSVGKSGISDHLPIVGKIILSEGNA